MKNKSLVTLLSILLLGCAITERNKDALNSWLGVQSDILVASWGPAQGGHISENGDTVIEYRAVNGALLESHIEAPYKRQEIKFICLTQFTVNQSGVITDWSQNGNDCKSKSKT